MWKAKYEGADMWEAKYDRADMWEAKYEGADMWEAKYEGADMWQAKYEGADMWQAKYKGADMWQQGIIKESIPWVVTGQFWSPEVKANLVDIGTSEPNATTTLAQLYLDLGGSLNFEFDSLSFRIHCFLTEAGPVLLGGNLWLIFLFIAQNGPFVALIWRTLDHDWKSGGDINIILEILFKMSS